MANAAIGASSPEEDNGSLDYVYLSKDNNAILLKGIEDFKIKLPKKLHKRRDFSLRRSMVEKAIYDGCNRFKVDTRTSYNVSKLATEVVNELSERSKAAASSRKRSKASSSSSASEYYDNHSNGQDKGDGDDDEEEEESKSTARANGALSLAAANSKEIFLNEFGRPFAAMRVNDHVEIHPIDEERFKNWVSGLWYKHKGGAILNDEDLKKIVRIVTARAESESDIKTHKLDVRVRGYNNSGDSDNSVGSVGSEGTNRDLMEDFDTIYYDLTNRRWEVVEITSKGWEINRDPPPLFRRYGSEVAQPHPDRNYEPNTLDELLDLLNLMPEYKDIQKQLLKPHVVSLFWPNTTPKPAPILPASQGSAKTTAFEIIRDLVDPNSALTMSIPKELHNLKQTLAHNYISFFDNVSEITDEQSDTLCRAITGSGDMKRKLYENDGDIIYNYRRIVGLNGITNAATRADLLDRGVIYEFAEIPKEKRELLKVIWRKYYKIKAKVLAFCFDVLVEVIKERQKYRESEDDYYGMKELIAKTGGLPRMADWAILGEQISRIIARKEGREYEPGSFLKAFDLNQEILNIEALKSSLLAEGLLAFMTERESMNKGTEWEGSSTMLLSTLNEYITSNEQTVKINIKSKAWPQDPAVFGKELARIKANLRPLGIVIESNRTNRNVLHKIIKLPTLPTQTEKSSSSEDSKECRQECRENEPTQLPTLEEGEDHAQKDDSVRSASSVGKIVNHGEVVNTIIQRVMSYESPSDHFTWDDFIYAAVMTPNLRWTEDQAEQTLYALIEEGKLIEEFEPGKYRLRPIGGGA